MTAASAAQISPKSNLPPAARRQVEAANALIAQLNAKPGEIPPGTEFQVMPSNEVPGQNPTGQQQRWVPASPQPQPQPPNPTGTAAPQQPNVAAAQPSAPPPPTAAQLQQPPRQEDPYEQRYRTLQGKYDAEMRAMREIVQTQQVTMDKLMENNRSAVAPTAPAQEPQQSPEDYLRSLGVTEKELTDYGELLPIVAKLAQNMIRPTAAKLEAELTKTRQAAGQTSAALVQDRQRALFTALDAHPVVGTSWRVLNDDTDFLAWLDGVDILSGVSRRNLMTDAFQKLDLTRIAAIFGAYIQEDSARRSASGPTIDPNTLIAPGTPRGGAAEAPGGANGRRMISEGEIANFYSRVRRKLVSPEEYKAFSAEIATATAEGRIVPNARDHHLNGR
jgi:hypothetical protein